MSVRHLLTPAHNDLAPLLAPVEALARPAGAVILHIYGSEFDVQWKADASPVTAADEAAEAVIVPGLRALTPTWPVVAEEAVSRGECAATGPRFWLVDPLDGTREFVARNGEFTVNIALVENHQAIAGVVYVPVRETLYFGTHEGGAWRAVNDCER